MYITEHSEQIQLIREMTQLRKDMNTYEVFYHHPYTNQTWKSFFPKKSGKNLGPKILRHEPLPGDLKDLMSVCLTEKNPQNATGLGIELSETIENWPVIFTILEDNFSSYDSGQIRRFLNSLQIESIQKDLDKLNLNELNITEEYLKKLVWKSRKLKLKSFIL